MLTAKVFENGRSQAVRLPKAYRFKEDEVMVTEIAGIVMLIPKGNRWELMKKAIDLFTDDFMADGRPKQLEQSERQKL